MYRSLLKFWKMNTNKCVYQFIIDCSNKNTEVIVQLFIADGLGIGLNLKCHIRQMLYSWNLYH